MDFRFADDNLRTLFETGYHRKYRLPVDIVERFVRVVKHIERAETLEGLRTPPSLRIEKLQGERRGQWSLRVNDQYRLVFEYDAAQNELVILELSKHYE